MTWQRVAGVAALGLTVAPAGTARPIHQTPTRVRTSGHVTIWPKQSIAHFRFCSRTPIAPVSGTWTPDWRDVARVEAALPGSIAAWRNRPFDGRSTPPRYFLTPGQFELNGWASHWNRNYIGIVRDGRRLLYVDFARAPARDGFSICDGGAGFFGIEVDPRDWSIVTLDVNATA